MNRIIQVVPHNCESQAVVGRGGFFVSVDEGGNIITQEGTGTGSLYEIGKDTCPEPTTKRLSVKGKLLSCMESRGCEFCG